MGITSIITAFFLVIGSPFISGCAYQSFVTVGGNCYFFSKDRGEEGTWDQAKRSCKDLGNDVGLAELGDSVEANDLLLKELAKRGGFPWLGGYKTTGGHWIWDHSQRKLPISLSYWAHDEPSGDGVKLSGIGKHAHGRYNLNDLPNSSVQSFVCQIFK